MGTPLKAGALMQQGRLRCGSMRAAGLRASQADVSGVGGGRLLPAIWPGTRTRHIAQQLTRCCVHMSRPHAVI